MKSCRLFITMSFCLWFSFSTPEIQAQSGWLYDLAKAGSAKWSSDRVSFVPTQENPKAEAEKDKGLIGQEESEVRIAAHQQRLASDINLLLPGATPEQAGQVLDRILQNLADASHVELTRVKNLPDQKFPENLTKVTKQLETNCNFDQLVRFLEAIKSCEKFLRVEELFIASYSLQGKYEIHNPSLKVSGFVEGMGDDLRAQGQSLEKKVDAAEASLFRRDQNLELLRELTGLLPPDTILTFYRNQDCTIQLRGICPPSLSSDLIEKLEKSPFLKDVTSPAGRYRDPWTGKDVFTFSAKCEK
jgi:hypothetical protein